MPPSPTPAGATGPATTTWTLDDLNRVTLVTQPVPDPGQAAPTWQDFYNADSVLTKQIDPLGRTQTTTLDGMDRTVSQTGFDGVQTAWAYIRFRKSPARPSVRAASPRRRRTLGMRWAARRRCKRRRARRKWRLTWPAT